MSTSASEGTIMSMKNPSTMRSRKLRASNNKALPT